MKKPSAAKARAAKARHGVNARRVRTAQRARVASDSTMAVRAADQNEIAIATVAATDLKNQLGRYLDLAMRGEIVSITKHGAPKAVLLSVERFDALNRMNERTLNSLSREFDDLLDRMQTSRARAGMKAAFAASPKELGQAAVAAARKRG